MPQKWFHSITIDHTKVPGDLTDMSLILTQVDFSTEFKTLGGSKAPKTDGGDVRFYTDVNLTNQTPFDLINFTLNATPANSRIEFVVKVNLSSSVNTEIYVAWGDTSLSLLPANNAYGQYNAYKSGFKLWCPMRDDPDTSHVKDRTINALSGTKTSAGRPQQVVDAGTMNEAQRFVDSSSDHIQFASIATGSQFTVITPFNYQGGGAPGYQRIVTNKNFWSDTSGFSINLFLGSFTQLQITGSSGAQWSPVIFTNISTDGWENLTVRYNGTNVDIFNGTVKTSGAGVIASVTNNPSGITLGDDANFTETKFNGYIDPIAIYVGALSDAEIIAMNSNRAAPGAFVLSIGATQNVVLETFDTIIIF